MQNGVLTANGVNLEGSFTMTSGSIDITADSEAYNIIKMYSGDPNGLHYFSFMNSSHFGAQQSRPASSASVSRFFYANLSSEDVEVSETINGELSGWRTRITSREISNSNNTSLATNDSMYFTISSTNGYYLQTKGGDTLFSATRQGIMENGTLLANKYATISSLSNYATVSSLSSYFALSRIKTYTTSLSISANTWTRVGTLENLLSIDCYNNKYFVIVNTYEGTSSNCNPSGIHIQYYNSYFPGYATRNVIAHTENSYTNDEMTTTYLSSKYDTEIYVRAETADTINIIITVIKID